MDVTPETKLNKQSTFTYKSFAGSSQLTDGSSDFTCDLNQKHDLNHLLKEVPLKQLASGSPDLLDQSPSRLRETDETCSSQDTLTRVYAVSITFAIGVTAALILHIYLGQSQVFVKGVVVSDHKRCTELGLRVLDDRGSSVDAAITAALCLGVVHPHASGVGGGGVMLVHDIHQNETRVINFQGSAPKTLKEEMLPNVSELKAGLQVGVPGLLRGLHRAHSLYGSLSWEDVVTRAAVVAKEGFNVSFSLAEAILKVKCKPLSQRFRDVFLPDGQALLPGSFLRMSSLAAVLEAGLSDFYDGNVSREMEDEVRTNGGVLSRKDISDYSAQVEQPVEGLYKESIIQVPPPPSAGAALMSVINLLEGLYLNNQTYHWETETELLAGQVVVMGPDGLMVSVASSLSTPFGSRIITRSGVILNSLILDFSWPHKTRGQLFTNQKNRVQPGKRPVLSLMPTLVVPAWHKCGLYLALSSSGGKQSLSVINQVLISALSFHKEKNESLSLRRLHPQPQPNRLPVESEFPDESVRGILRSNDIITAISVSVI